MIVLTRKEIPEVENIFKLLWDIQIFNVNLLFYDKSGGVSVVTFMPFNSDKCDDTKPVLIDRFKDGKFVNSAEKLFPEKMRNLQRCPVRISTSGDAQPYVFTTLLSNGSHQISGRDFELIKTLSQSLNFTYNFTFVGPLGYFLDNGSAEGPAKALLDGKADLSVANWWINKNLLKFIDVTCPYSSDAIIFLVPPGRAFSAIEKLIFPFTYQVWGLFLACFLVGCVVIVIIKRRTSTVQNFVFGSEVKTPGMNLCIGCLGGSQTNLPTRNFARFMLMTFLMYSLIMRTLYQGLFYHLMKSSGEHKSIQTIDELIKQDFKLYVRSSLTGMINGTEDIRKR